MPIRLSMKALVLSVGLACTLMSLPARAGLFDDDEARKAILDLRTKQSQSEEQLRSELAAAVRTLSDQIQQMQRNQLDQSNQMEQLRAELARLRGLNEQLARDLSDLQRRHKDSAQQFDERLRKFEPQKVTVDGREFVATVDERKGYEEAIGILRAGDFDKAAPALSGFIKRYPDSGYVDSARYWLGNAQYGRREYKEAVASFKAYLAASADSPRAPEAMLALANCQAEMKEVKVARKTLEDLIRLHPKTEAAQAAKERLGSLR